MSFKIETLLIGQFQNCVLFEGELNSNALIDTDCATRALGLVHVYKCAQFQYLK